MDGAISITATRTYTRLVWTAREGGPQSLVKQPFTVPDQRTAFGRLLSFGAVAERNAADYYRPPKSDVCDTSTSGNLNSWANLIIDAC
jgi:hypothetical protein